MHRSGHENSEVLDHALPIEEIVGRDEEVPAESTKPRQLVRPVDDVADGDNLMETFDLNQ